MQGSQLVEKLVLDSKTLGSLECEKNFMMETVRRLSDEAWGLKQTIADLAREKKKQRSKPGDNHLIKSALFERRFVLTRHQRALHERLRSISQNRRRALERVRMTERQIGLFKTRVAAARGGLLKNPPH